MKKIKKSAAVDESLQNSAHKDFLTVGIGASAGGIGALKQFFSAMPDAPEMAFVVILHLSDEHESSLAQILQTNTSMKVEQVTKTVKVEPNKVYVIPPAKGLEMVDGHIKLTEPEHIKGKRVPIDLFFRSLADAYGKNGIAVVLSGTGSDGTLGLKRVKENGGITVAQEPSEAEYDGMPQSAVNTGLVDLILPVAEIPARLLELRDTGKKIRLPQPKDEIPKTAKNTDAEALREILTIVRVRTGHDFANYKHATVLRRIARRLQVHGLTELPEYLTYLRANKNEAGTLQRDLLITVTNFFRDREAFEELEKEIIPKLFAGKTAADTVRVWSVGCATGDEAYSLAILLEEFASHITNAPKIQIFASDINEDAIAAARDCFYDEGITADVSPERLRRYFVKETGGWRVRKELRETVLFTPHNVLRDPPFSRLDLVTCRNLMIYFNRETQKKVMGIFNFALRNGGFLFLGASESAETATALFVAADKKQRIYKARNTPQQQTLPDLPAPGKWNVKVPPPPVKSGDVPLSSFGAIHYTLVEQFAPPSVLVSENNEILHVSEHAARFLRVTPGEPSRDLFETIHPALKLDLQSALFAAQKESFVSESRNVRFENDGKETLVNITVRQIHAPETAQGFYLIIFDESKSAAAPEESGQTAQTVAGRDAMDNIVQRLEAELRINRDKLRATIEQNETSGEELKASNEELQAINEELHSASEELETSREELQSLNEELTTINAELREKVDETVKLNSDLQNLIQSTDIGTIFLDRALCIKRYTPRIADVFNIIPSDIGRPLEHITHNFADNHLSESAGEVLRTLQPKEREMHGGSEDHRYLVRIAPYRTIDDRIDGVVLNFLDITDIKRASDALIQSEAQLSAIFNQTTAGMVQSDLQGNITLVNDRFCEIVGYDYDKLLKMRLHDLTHEEDLTKSAKLFERTAQTGEPFAIEKRYVRKDGSTVWVHTTVTTITDADGKPQYLLVVALDISERKQTEAALQKSEEKYRTLFDSMDEGFCLAEVIFDDAGHPFDHRIMEANPAFEKHTGIRNIVGKLASEAAPGIEQYWNDIYGQVVVTGETVRLEQSSDALNRWFDVFVARVGGAESRQVAILFKDITERKRREQNLAFLAEITQELGRLMSIDEIMQTVGAKIGEYLNLSACAFVEIDKAANGATVNHAWNRADVPAIGGFYRLSEWLSEEFQKAGRAGEPFIVSNTQTDSRTDAENFAALKIGSFLSVPILQEGEWRFLLVAYNSEPHDWQVDEIELIGELTTRIWTRLERARAEVAVRESEEKYRNLFNSIDEGFCVIEMIFDDNEKPLDYRFLENNPAFTRQCGLTDVIGKRMLELRAEHEAYWFEIYGKVALTGEAIRFEAVSQSLEGRSFDIYASRVGKPEERKVAVVFNDITERKRSEEKLSQSEERLRLVLESVADYAIITTDAAGIITGWNSGAKASFGYAENEVVGQSIEIIFTPEDRAAGVVKKEINTARERGHAPDERFHLHRDGSRIFVSGVITPILNGDGDLQGYVKIARDMTEQIKVEKIKRDKEILQKMVGAQEIERKRIARDLHDELGQQMTALRMKIEAAGKKFDDNEELSADIDEMQVFAEKLDTGIDFLAWELRPAALDDLGLTAALARYVQEWSHYSGITAEFLESNIKNMRFAPEAETNLYRIVQESLNNIYKHAEARRVEIALDKRGDLIVLIIEDDGAGFDTEDKSIQEKGIGLIGMRERAVLIGGSFEIESTPGDGTSVFVRVPV